MGARLGVVIGALVVAALLAAAYFLFWREEPESRRAEAPVSEPAPSQGQPESPAVPQGSEPQPGEEPQAPAPAGAQGTTAAPGAPGTTGGAPTAPGAGTTTGSAPQSQSADRGAAGPRVVEPEGAEPRVAEPQVSAPAGSEPRVSEPRVSEPQVSEPQVSEPQVSEPQVSEPGVAEPGLAEPAPAGQVAAVPSRRPVQPEAAAPGLPNRAVPSFDVVHVERSGSAVIAGRAEPGSRITILRNGEVLGTAETDAAGEWVFLTDRPLAPGDHQLSLVARGRDGRDVEATRVVVVSVPKPDLQVARQPGAPEGAEPVAPGTVEPRGPVAVAIDKSGEGDVVVLQGIDAGVAVGDLVLETLRYDAEGRVTVTGKVVPDGRVFAYIDEAFVGEARGDAEGDWRLRPDEPVAMGLHRLRLDQVDAGGAVLARLETPFARSTLLTDLPEGERLVIVQPGNSLWRIAQRTLGQGLRYTVIFEANESQIRNPDLIYPGQVFVVPEEKGPPS